MSDPDAHTSVTDPRLAVNPITSTTTSASTPTVATVIDPAADTFVALEQRIEDEVARDFGSLEITPDGVDWERAGLRGPSATWTYLVGENPFGASGLLSPAGRTGMVAAAMGAPWLVLLHWLGILWERRQRRRQGANDRR